MKKGWQCPGVRMRVPPAESSETVNEDRRHRCLMCDEMGANESEGARRSAFELGQPLAETGKANDWGMRF